MSKNKIIKVIFSLMLCAIMVVNLSIPANAKPVTKIKVMESTTKKQYTNIYSIYKSFDVIPFVKGKLTVKFNSAKKIMVKDITGACYWSGRNNEAESLTLEYSKSVSIEKSSSVELTKKIGAKVSIKAVEISEEMGCSDMKSRTFTKSEMSSYSYKLDRSSSEGYYSIVAAVNADLFDTKLDVNGKAYNGKMLKLQSVYPYITLYRSNSSF